MKKVSEPVGKSKMHVVWLHSHFLYWMGGTKFVYEVCKQLVQSEKVASLSVIVENASDEIANRYAREGISLISMNGATSTSAIYWLFFPFFMVRDYLFIQAFLRQHALNLQETTVISSMFPMNVIARWLRVRHIQNCYEPFAFFYFPEFTTSFGLLKRLGIKLIALLYSPLDIHATQHAHQVLTLNSVSRQLIADTYHVTADVTQAGVDGGRFKPHTSERVRSLFDGKQVLIHCTDYTPSKGTSRVILAFSDVVATNQTACLIITSTLNNEVAKQKLQLMATKLGIQNHVIFLDRMSEALLPQLFSIANGIILSSAEGGSRLNSMALPVKEAYYCGTPAVRPEWGGEDTIDGETGFIVDPANKTLLAEKMIFLVDHPEIARKMGMAGRQRARVLYTWKSTAQVFEKHL